MSFAHPLALLLGLAGLLLLWFHRRRRPPVTVTVSGVHLWRAVASEVAPSRRRPGRTLPLILQLLVLALLVLAVARPGGPGGPLTVGGVVLLLDASRDMQATDVRPSRFGAAVEDAARLVSRTGGPVTVILVSRRARVLAFARTDRAAVAVALRRERATDAAPDWEGAARTLRALQVKGPVTAFVSAGQLDAARLALAPLGARVRGLGGPLDQAGLRDLRVTGDQVTVTAERRAPPGAARVQARTVTFSLDGRDWTRVPLQLAAGQPVPVTVPLPAVAAGVVRAALDADAAPADDRAWLVRRVVPDVRAEVVGPVDGPLVRALRAVPGTRVVQVARPDGQADLLVVTGRLPDASRPTAPLRGPVVWANAAAVPGAAAVTATGWNAGSPLSRDVDWSALTARPGPAGSVWPDGEALVSGPDGPLIETRADRDGWALRFRFPLEGSGFVDQAAFPVFVQALVERVRPGAGQAQRTPCVVGLPCAVPAGPGEVTGPDGARFVPDLSGQVVPLRAGVYRAGGEDFAVNGAGISDLSAGTADPAGREDAGGRWLAFLASFTVDAVLWRALLLAGLAVLTAEAWLAWRRGRHRSGCSAASAALLLLALLDVPLPAPPGPPVTAVLGLPGQPLPAGAAGPGVWGSGVWGPGVWGPDGSGAASPAGTTGPAPGAARAADLASGLEVAAAGLPDGRPGRVVVLGTRWPASSALPEVLGRLRSAAVPVDAVPDAGRAPAVTLADLHLPARVRAGEPFALDVLLDAREAATVRVTLRRADEPLLDRQVTLRAGANRLRLPLREALAGVAGYTVAVTGPDGRVTGQAGTRVLAAPVALVVGGDDVRAGAVRALGVQGFTVREALPGRVDAAALRDVQGVVLLDTPARALGADARAGLDRFVRSGGQLVIGGGAHAYALGGYPGTVLETLSPLSSRVPRDAPKLALGLVLDKSGSMNELVSAGVSKLDLIKAAAFASVRQLHPDSEVSVVAFDTSPKLAVPLQRLGDGRAVARQVQRIEAEGGTVVMRALDAAGRQLGASRAARRHLILLTDGIDGGIFNPQEYERKVRRLRASGMTVSTVSVGSGMHVPLMRDIARWGGGVFAQSDDWRDVPSMMAQDTLAQGLPGLVATPVALRWAGGLAPDAQVSGYVRTGLRDGATLLAGTPDGQPLAARWPVGLGTVTAFAAPLGGAGARPWMDGAGYAPTLSAVTRGSAGGTEVPSALERVGDDLLVRAARAQVTLTGPDGPRVLTLVPLGKGFGTLLDAPSPGGYSVTGAAAGVLPAPSRVALLREVSAVTGGTDGTGTREGRWRWAGAAGVWTVLALLAFLTGVALRERARRLPGTVVRKAEERLA